MSSARPLTSRLSDRRSVLRTGMLGALGIVTAGAALSGGRANAAGIHGQDVSSHQGEVDWGAQAAAGSRFAWCKATEGTDYRNPFFAQQYGGSYEAGLAHGAYHFARPDGRNPVGEADFFIDNGGGWSDDGRTLPALLDLEGYHNLPANYGLTQPEMQDWIQRFCNRYTERVGRSPIIYSNVYWYRENVGAWAPDGAPLHIAAYQEKAPTNLPEPWTAWDVWQYSDSGPFAGDSNVFHGDEDAFKDFLVNPNYRPVGR